MDQTKKAAIVEPFVIEKALSMLWGIGGRNPDLASAYVHPETFRDHNPDAAAGIQGLRDWVSRLPPPTVAQQTVRVLEDGAYVVTHSMGELPFPCVFFDVFRFADGRIVEHWLFREEAASANSSGHAQTDGPTEPTRFQHREANKSLVTRYYDAVHIAGHHEQILKFVSADHVRHEPGVHDGLFAFLRDLERFNGPGKPSRTFGEVKLTLGQGDLVFVAATGTLEDAPCIYVDLYRTEVGMLVEHWGFIEKEPNHASRKNDNGML